MPPWRRSFRAVLEQNARLVEAVMALQGGQVFLDASKDTNRLRFLLDAGLWDLRVIYMIRDGRGAANSFMRHHGVPMAVAAREWRTTHQECDRLVAGLPLDSVTTLHYEQLCEAPDAETARILRFLGLDPALAAGDRRAAEHHILGNSMRLRASSEIRLDEKWRAALSAAQLATFRRIAADLNSRYRYGSSRRPVVPLPPSTFPD